MPVTESRLPATLGNFILGGVCGGVSVCSSGNEPIPTWLPVRLLLLPLLELRCECCCGWLPVVPWTSCCCWCWCIELAGWLVAVAVAGGPVNTLIWGLLRWLLCWYELLLLLLLWSVSM